MKGKPMWMVRAGRGAEFLDDFIQKNIVAIGWHLAGKIAAGESREQIAHKVLISWPKMSRGKVAISAGQIYRFLNEIAVSDRVVTYDPSRRVYHVGEILSEPTFDESCIEELPRIRDVKWLGEVSRDQLMVATKNSLGAISKLCSRFLVRRWLTSSGL